MLGKTCIKKRAYLPGLLLGAAAGFTSTGGTSLIVAPMPLALPIITDPFS